MATTRKDAGEARERPKASVAVAVHPKADPRMPSARPAGIAPAFDAVTLQLTPRAGPHKGMISNPWVKHWAGAGPPPMSKPVVGAQAQPGAKPKAAQETGPRRVAGPAPKPPRRGKE
jgi:hypothetical protein